MNANRTTEGRDPGVGNPVLNGAAINHSGTGGTLSGKKDDPAGSEFESVREEIREIKDKLGQMESRFDMLIKLIQSRDEYSADGMDNGKTERLLAARNDFPPDGMTIGNAQRLSAECDGYPQGGMDFGSTERLSAMRNGFWQHGMVIRKTQRQSVAQNQLNNAENEKPGAERIPQEQNKKDLLAKGTLEFAGIWKNESWKVRSRRDNRQKYAEIIKNYPSLELPGVKRLNAEIRSYGINCVLAAQKLTDLVKTELKKTYTTDTFLLSAAKVLIFLSKEKISARAAIFAGTGTSKTTATRVIKTLKSLGLITILRRDRHYNHYIITEKGKKMMDEFA